MINQTFDPAEVNRIINHPDVFPHVSDGQDYPLDCSKLMDGRNIFLACEGGGFCLVWKAENHYEGHYYFLPDFRGRHAIRVGKEALQWVSAHGYTLEGHTPLGNKAARLFNKLIGMRAVSKNASVEKFIWP